MQKVFESSDDSIFARRNIPQETSLNLAMHAFTTKYFYPDIQTHKLQYSPHEGTVEYNKDDQSKKPAILKICPRCIHHMYKAGCLT